jgi:replicative DNA helicase
MTLIKADAGDDSQRAERVGKLAKGLKQLARELSIPVIALSQINRIGEGQMPGLENLRQSGEIEEDSDLVLLLHRKRDERETILRVAKNRRGPVGDVTLRYIPDFTLFEEADHGAR